MTGKKTPDTILSASMAAELMGEGHPVYARSRNDLLRQILVARGAYDSELLPAKKQQTEAMAWGDRLEETVVREAVSRAMMCYRRYGERFDTAEDGSLLVISPENPVYSPDGLWAASLDAFLDYPENCVIRHPEGCAIQLASSETVYGPGVIEAKVTSARPEDFPPSWRGVWQLQVQMMCMGASWGVLAVLYGGTCLKIHIIGEDKKAQAALTKAALDFYERLEGPDWYPAKDARDAADTWSTTEEEAISLEPVREDVEKLMSVRRKLQVLSEQEKQLSATLMTHLANHSSGWLEDEHGKKQVEILWPMRHYKEQPERVVPKKPARSVRQKTLVIPKKWMAKENDGKRRYRRLFKRPTNKTTA